MESMTTELVMQFAATLIVGVMSGFAGAWIAIRVLGKEVEWINKTLDKHDKSIDRLHGRFSDHVTHFHSDRPKPGQ